jgi:hypothetical protein
MKTRTDALSAWLRAVGIAMIIASLVMIPTMVSADDGTSAQVAIRCILECGSTCPTSPPCTPGGSCTGCPAYCGCATWFFVQCACQ